MRSTTGRASSGDPWSDFAESDPSGRPPIAYARMAMWLLGALVCVAWAIVFATKEITIDAPDDYRGQVEPQDARFSCGTVLDTTPQSFEPTRLSGPLPLTDFADAVQSECDTRRLGLGSLAIAPGLSVGVILVFARRRRTAQESALASQDSQDLMDRD